MSIVRSAALVLAFAFVFLSGCSRDNASPALQVNDVGADPAAYTGTLAVVGVTGGFSTQDPAVFGIMDLKELQCQTPNCKKWLLPVRFAGDLPVMGDEVRVTGSFVPVQGGYLFKADQVEVLRNHKLGG